MDRLLLHCRLSQVSRRKELEAHLSSKEMQIISRGITSDLFFLDIRLLCRSALKLLTRKPVVLLLIGHSTMVILSNAIFTFYGQMMRHFADSENDVVIGIAGALAGFAGGLGGMFFGYLFDRTKKFKAITIFLVIATTACFALFTGLLVLGNSVADTVTLCLIGFFLMSLWSTGQNFGGELIYPEKESLYALILFTVTSVLSSAFQPIIQEVLLITGEMIHGTQVVGLIFTLMSLATLPLYALVKVTMNRTNQVVTS